jgi:hypothetical protein
MRIGWICVFNKYNLILFRSINVALSVWDTKKSFSRFSWIFFEKALDCSPSLLYFCQFVWMRCYGLYSYRCVFANLYGSKAWTSVAVACWQSIWNVKSPSSIENILLIVQLQYYFIKKNDAPKQYCKNKRYISCTSCFAAEACSGELDYDVWSVDDVVLFSSHALLRVQLLLLALLLFIPLIRFDRWHRLQKK